MAVKGDIPISIRAYGFSEMEQAVYQFGPGFAALLLGPALGRSAAVVRRKAKTKNYGFTDRNTPRGGGGAGSGRYKSLRQSIRNRRISARYEGRRYKRGRAAVFSGGGGARQSHLVERGHLGPYPAAPHPYINRAQGETELEQQDAFVTSMQRTFPTLLRRYIARRAGKAGRGEFITKAFARTESRRGRIRSFRYG